MPDDGTHPHPFLSPPVEYQPRTGSKSWRPVNTNPVTGLKSPTTQLAAVYKAVIPANSLPSTTIRDGNLSDRFYFILTLQPSLTVPL
jgi:hypothetical protein